MPKKIKFVPGDPYALKNIPAPIPSKEFIPRWYKDAEIAISRCNDFWIPYLFMARLLCKNI